MLTSTPASTVATITASAWLLIGHGTSRPGCGRSCHAGTLSLLLGGRQLRPSRTAEVLWGGRLLSRTLLFCQE